MMVLPISNIATISITVTEKPASAGGGGGGAETGQGGGALIIQNQPASQMLAP